MKKYYEAVGKVSGRCGHKHRTEVAAQICIEKLRNRSGFSDRVVVTVVNGKDKTPDFLKSIYREK